MQQHRPLRHGAKARQEFIRDCLAIYGGVNRMDLIEKFGIAAQTASTDFSIFSRRYPGATRYDMSSKLYVLDTGFYDHFPKTMSIDHDLDDEPASTAHRASVWQDLRDVAFLMRGDSMGRCSGGRIILGGHMCHHCGQNPPFKVCPKPVRSDGTAED